MTEMIPENEKVPEVFVYRLQAVETSVSQINLKLDTFISAYPTKEHLDLVIKPIENRVSVLEKEIEARERTQDHERSQVKLLILAAFLTPIAAIILSVLTQNYLGK